jgi:hypothetical protein
MHQQAACLPTCLQSSGQGYGENQGLGSAWRSCAAAMPLWLGGKGSYQPGGTPPSGAPRGAGATSRDCTCWWCCAACPHASSLDSRVIATHLLLAAPICRSSGLDAGCLEGALSHTELWRCLYAPLAVAGYVGATCPPGSPLQGSKEVGCGLAQCPDKGGFVVCFYDPPGNVNGQFDANVGGQGQGGGSPANTAG